MLIARRPIAVGLAVVGLGLALAFGTVYVVADRVEPDTHQSSGDRSLLDDGTVAEATGSFTTVTSSLRSFDRTVSVTAADSGLVVDTTPVTCHGGLLHIVWHIGNLEPTVPDTGIHLAVRLDGEPVGGILRGSTRGIWNDGPSAIHATAPCEAGVHVVDLLVYQVTGELGFPYVMNVGDPPPEGLVVNRGFVATEVWS